jgi:hypothetical protein
MHTELESLRMALHRFRIAYTCGARLYKEGMALYISSASFSHRFQIASASLLYRFYIASVLLIRAELGFIRNRFIY